MVQITPTPAIAVPPVQPLPVISQPQPGSLAPPGGGGGNATRTILPDGTVEIGYPDGRRVRHYEGGKTTILPDGSEQRLMFSTGARPPIPPALPDSAESAWLAAHSERLLDLIRTLVDDEQAVTNYLQFEGTVGVYDKIATREQTIGYLLRN